MHIIGTYLAASGVSVENAIIKIVGISINNTDVNGEYDPNNLYLGMQIKAFVSESSSVEIDTRYITMLYDKNSDAIEQSYNYLCTVPFIIDGVITND